MGCPAPSLTISDAEAREQLERILASDCMRKGARLSRLLRYVVESTLDGSADSLKESVLGTEVFERSSFDPRSDTLVRSTARHLRFKLDEYYKTEGAHDPVLIELPKGSYVPVFRRRETPSAPVSRRSRAVLAITLALALGGGAAIVLIGHPHATRTVLADTADPEAHDLYIQARYLWSRRDPEDVRRSIPLFERALRRDPRYALAWAGLADTWGTLADNGMVSPAEALPKAEAAAGRAVALAPQSAAVHASLGLLRSSKWDWPGAERELRLALRLDPEYGPTYARLARDATIHGRFAEAEGLLRHAQTADPLNWMLTYSLGENAYYARRYDESIAQASKIRTAMPFNACNLLERCWFHKGMLDQARAAAECEFENRPGPAANLIRATLIQPRTAAASLVRTFLERPLDGLDPFYAASTAARVGETDLALDWLERAWKLHDPDLASIGIEPDLDGLRGQPRFRALLKKIGLD